MQVCEAYVAVMEWAMRRGAEKLSEKPGLWTGVTDQWSVRINGHKDEIDNVPAFGIELSHKTFFQVAVIQPPGGAIVGDENALIEHFKTAA